MRMSSEVRWGGPAYDGGPHPGHADHRRQRSRVQRRAAQAGHSRGERRLEADRAAGQEPRPLPHGARGLEPGVALSPLERVTKSPDRFSAIMQPKAPQ